MFTTLIIGQLSAEESGQAPAPYTRGLTTQEQAHILRSEALLEELSTVLRESATATADEVVRRDLDRAQQLLADATRERDLADQAREAAARQSDTPAAVKSEGSGGWFRATAALLSEIAALGTSIAGLITAWIALRKARPPVAV